jgi:2-polyprenyl-3-methyl-5-hydroxy-6-metoxy-1,4-benzoquinol methylase
MKLVHVPCDLCGATDHRTRMRISSRLYLPKLLDSLSYVGWDPPLHWSIVQCRECGLVYVNPRVRMEALERLYPPARFWDRDLGKAREKSPRRWESQLEWVRRFKLQGRLLDIGCANGYLVEAASRAGFEAYGVELSGRAVQYAHEVLGLSRVFQGRVEDIGFPDAHFDVITMFDVLEHVSSPRRTLTEAVRILCPGGVFIAQMPSIDSLGSRLFGALWCYMQPAAHLTYFGQDTARRLLQETGLTLLEIDGPFFKIGVRSEVARKWRLLTYLWRWWRHKGDLQTRTRPNPFETLTFGGTLDLMVIVGQKAAGSTTQRSLSL